MIIENNLGKKKKKRWRAFNEFKITLKNNGMYIMCNKLYSLPLGTVIGFTTGKAKLVLCTH